MLKSPIRALGIAVAALFAPAMIKPLWRKLKGILARRKSVSEEPLAHVGEVHNDEANPAPKAPESPEASVPTADAPIASPPRDSATDRLLLFLVDLLDEIDALPRPGGDGREIALVRDRIADRILLSDGEVIRDPEWSPERQRAVEVEEGALDAGSPKVAESRASGLALAGRIVRKEEVKLSAR